MGLLDQLHSRSAVLAANVLGVRLMPLVAKFFGRLTHVFGQHEVSVVKQTGLRRAVRNSTVDDGPVRAFGLERQEGAFFRLRREEMVAVVEEQGVEIGLAHVM